MKRSFNFEAAQLIVPLMDLVTRWTLFGADEKKQAREYLKEAGFDHEEWVVVVDFLDALDKVNSDY